MMELSTRKDIIGEIVDKINKSNIIAIAGHVSPDGDSVASCLAFAMSVKKLGKTPVVLMEEIPNKYKSISGREFIKTEYPSELQAPDLFISCDCGSKDRMGRFEELFDKTEETIVVDHHISNMSFGKTNYVDAKSSSASELVYDVIAVIGNIDIDIASALYAGIIFDTGALRFKSCTPDTFVKVSKLVALGIPFDEIYSDIMLTRSYNSTLLFAHVVGKMKFMEGLPVVYSTVTKAEMESLGTSRQDLEGISGYMLNIEGAEVSVLLSEFGENESKASFRSKQLDVNTLASLWGGGGHINAAGATIKSPTEAALPQVLDALAERYNNGI